METNKPKTKKSEVEDSEDQLTFKFDYVNFEDMKVNVNFEDMKVGTISSWDPKEPVNVPTAWITEPIDIHPSAAWTLTNVATGLSVEDDGSAWTIVDVPSFKIDEIKDLSDKEYVKSDFKTSITFDTKVKYIYPPKSVSNLSGDVLYHKEGTWELHRDDGPAVERKDGTKEWWLNGRRHREDGPALIDTSGPSEWWFHGLKHTATEFDRVIRINKELRRLFKEARSKTLNQAPRYSPLDAGLTTIDLTAHLNNLRARQKISEIEAAKEDDRITEEGVKDFKKALDAASERDDKIKRALLTTEGKKALGEAMALDLRERLRLTRLKRDVMGIDIIGFDEVEEKAEAEEEALSDADSVDDVGWGLALGALALAAALKSRKQTKKEKEKIEEEQSS